MSAQNYYVDSVLGNDTNDGLSEAAPWKTIWKVDLKMSAFCPGDRILLKRGGVFYNYGLLIRNLHGTAEKPIVFSAYGVGEPPVLDGVKTISFDTAWRAEGGNIYSRATYHDIEPNLVIYDGTPLPAIETLSFPSVPAALKKNAVLLQMDDGTYTNFWVTSTTTTTVSGISRFDLAATGKPVYVRQIEGGREVQWPGSLGIPQPGDGRTGLIEPGNWYWDGITKRIYLYSDRNLADPDTGESTVLVNTLGDGIRMENSTHVVVENIRVRYFNKQGIVLLADSNVTVRNVNVYGCGKTGIQIWSSSNNLIQNNTIDSCSGGISLYAPDGYQTDNNLVLGNTVADCRGACIGLSRDLETTGSIAGNVISGNRISRANTMSYDGAGVYTFYAGTNTIANNTIKFCGSTYLRSAGIMVDWSDGPMTITGNLLEYNSTGGVVVSGNGHLVSGNTMRNNGVSGMGRGQVGFFAAGSVASNCTVTDNSMYAGYGYRFIVAEYGSCSGHRIDSNSYRYSGTQDHFFWPCVSDQWMGFETWRDLTGQDKHSTIEKVISSILSMISAWIAPLGAQSSSSPSSP